MNTVFRICAVALLTLTTGTSLADGEIVGPRMRVSGPALGITGGHCDNNLLPPQYASRAGGVADGAWAVRERVREIIKYGAGVIYKHADPVSNRTREE